MAPIVEAFSKRRETTLLDNDRQLQRLTVVMATLLAVVTAVLKLL
jgi:hypothetical protein